MSNTRKKIKKKPQKKINHMMKGKLVGLFAVVLLALVCLLGRITYINAISGNKYKKQVLTQAQQKYESNILPAKRGDIYDRNGNILATSNKVYNVILDCKAVNSEDGRLCRTYGTGTDRSAWGWMRDDIRYQTYFRKVPKTASIRSSRNSCPWMTRRHLMNIRSSYLKTAICLNEQNKERSNVKGVWFEEDYLRSYPFNESCL